ncbi:MAG TPA: transporter [Croceibacterium sp.]|nr:transporter [Croceibacterium sp.]
MAALTGVPQPGPWLLAPTAFALSLAFAPGVRAQASDEASLRARLDAAIAQLERQQQQIDSQAHELAELRRMLDAQAQAALPAAPEALAVPPGSSQPAPVPLERVGQAPEDEERPIELAVLRSEGSVVTRRGQLVGEAQYEYARADRTRAVFRGVELLEAVLVGVFDINESRQDLLTGSLALRYGLADRLEIGARLPYVYRWDTQIRAPIAGSTQDDAAATVDSSVDGRGIGDLELTTRYQLLDGGRDRPYVIANLQGVIPTGRDPFGLPRDRLGRALDVATGSGFYTISPGFTVIMPSDPVVLFGTLGYNWNFGKSVDTNIPPLNITYIDPGDSIEASAGIGISFNQRTTINLGYAHNWAFGTLTRTVPIDPPADGSSGLRETVSRDLQIGRLLFGVTYRVTDRASLNWSVEVGATEDAADVRTVLRIPIVLLTGG